MDSFSVSVSTTVVAPPAEVHELLDDLAAHRRWTDHFLVDWELIGDPHGVGAKARFRAKGAGPNARGEIEVLSSTPTRIVEEGRGGKDLSRRTRGTYELAPADGGGTVVTSRTRSGRRRGSTRSARRWPRRTSAATTPRRSSGCASCSPIASRRRPDRLVSPRRNPAGRPAS